MDDTTHSDPSTRSLPQLLRDLSHNVADLLRSEIALARAEASEKVNQAASGLTSVAVGAVFGLAALIIVLQALVIALSEVMEPWLASALVGVVVAALAFFMITRGRKQLAATNLTPERTAENLGRDAQVFSDHVRTDRPAGAGASAAASSTTPYPVTGVAARRDVTEELSR